MKSYLVYRHESGFKQYYAESFPPTLRVPVGPKHIHIFKEEEACHAEQAYVECVPYPIPVMVYVERSVGARGAANHLELLLQRFMGPYESMHEPLLEELRSCNDALKRARRHAEELRDMLVANDVALPWYFKEFAWECAARIDRERAKSQ